MGTSKLVEQLGKKSGGLSKKLQSSFAEPALLSLAVDMEAFVNDILTSPNAIQSANGLAGALGISTFMEMMEGNTPEKI